MSNLENIIKYNKKLRDLNKINRTREKEMFYDNDIIDIIKELNKKNKNVKTKIILKFEYQNNKFFFNFLVLNFNKEFTKKLFSIFILDKNILNDDLDKNIKNYNFSLNSFNNRYIKMLLTDLNDNTNFFFKKLINILNDDDKILYFKDTNASKIYLIKSHEFIDNKYEKGYLFLYTFDFEINKKENLNNNIKNNDSLNNFEYYSNINKKLESDILFFQNLVTNISNKLEKYENDKYYLLKEENLHSQLKIKMDQLEYSYFYRTKDSYIDFNKRKKRTKEDRELDEIKDLEEKLNKKKLIFKNLKNNIDEKDVKLNELDNDIKNIKIKLNNKNNINKKVNKEYRNLFKCKICEENIRNTFVIPCCHIFACNECLEKFCKKLNYCLYCNNYFTNFFKLNH